MVQLYKGDCMELMESIPDESVDMILSDPPYAMTKNKWDVEIDLPGLWRHYKRIVKQNGAIVLFSKMPFTARLAISNQKMFRHEWIWVKESATGFLNANKAPMKLHENILVFSKKRAVYNPQMRTGFRPYKCVQGSGSKNYENKKYDKETVSNGERFPVDVIRFSRSLDRGAHPTQKPVALLEYMIRTYTSEGETVLDNYMGSGSTGVACVNTGRNFIGIELDDYYFDVAQQRIEQAQK